MLLLVRQVIRNVRPARPIPMAPPQPRVKGWIVLLTALAGCNGGSDPNVPASITVTPPSVTFTALGQTQPLSASVSDQNGNPLPDAGVSWSSNNAAVATVGSNGMLTAVGAGTALIQASAGGATAEVPVTVTQTPTQLQKVAGDAQTGPAGQPLPTPLTVELRDALGNTIPGALVSFTVIQGGGNVASPSATTDGNGRASTAFTLGTTAGPNHQVSATSEVAAVSTVFLATASSGPPASAAIHTGNGQTAAPGAAVAIPPAARVTDALGNPASGVSVVFTGGAGGGSVTGADATTDANGVARVGSWTLGSAGANTLVATVAGDGITGNPVTFTATATASVVFDIKVRFLTSATTAQRQAFDQAEARWEGIITGDLSNVPLTAEAGTCGDNSPLVDETVDDVLILATVEEIDGPGATLAQAGPCYIRTANDLTIMGLMRFDEADLADIEAVGALPDIILHEMGHVLGFGTLWELQGLLADAKLTGGTDPHFTGSEGIAAFNAVGGTAYSGAKVPVEDQGGAGTADAHWRESVMDDELMTGFVALDAPSTNPLSIVTIAALEDQGYSVNSSAADPYTLGLSLRAKPRGPMLHLGDDRLRVPLRVVDPEGRVTRVVPR